MSERTIRRLDERTVERIAAGEVVERPASVVKELVENSIDAAATRVNVSVEGGGIDRIEVRDDGVGMTGEQLPRAVAQHTTSKLRDAKHLESGIDSLGFRGEALHTIAAVSRLTITSRPRGDEDAAHALSVEGGTIGDVEPAGAPAGTTVEVRDLFYNTPARREFLGTTQTEFDHVNRVVTEYALANPDVAFSLSHDGREVFTTSGRGDLEETVLAVWGRDVAEAMVPFDAEGAEWIDRVHGLASDPAATRSRPRYLATFVNGRAVRSGTLREGIIDGYDHRLASDRYPFVVLFSEVDPPAVDVNVHPRKTEVRFEAADRISERVATAVRRAIREEGDVPASATRGRAAPAETRVGDFHDESSAEGEPSYQRGGGADASAKHGSFQAPTRQRTMDGAEPSPSLNRLPAIRLLGQIADTYLVGESEDGLVLVDQHAADERIHYEQLREAFAERPRSQALVEPVDIELTGSEADGFRTVARAIEELGFAAEAIEERRIRVTAVPGIFEEAIPPERITDALIAAIETSDPGTDIAALADALLADMACHPAITGNEALAEGSMIDLLEALDDCEEPLSCPHGRPTMIRIDADELGDRFERDYPGHDRRPNA